MFAPFAIAILTIIVGFGAYQFGAFAATKRIEVTISERYLAYKAMRGWGTYQDPERLAFIEGWLDQVFKPGVPTAPSMISEASRAAYMSGWVWSRERDLIETHPAEEPQF